MNTNLLLSKSKNYNIKTCKEISFIFIISFSICLFFILIFNHIINIELFNNSTNNSNSIIILI